MWTWLRLSILWTTPLLIVKTSGIWFFFDNLSIEFMKNYIKNRKQRCKVGNLVTKITSGVPKGSILGPLIFSVFTNDIFLFAKNSHSVLFWKKTFAQVLKNLQTDFRTLKEWFYHNFLVLNPKIFHFSTLGNGKNLCNSACDDKIIKNGLLEKKEVFHYKQQSWF